MKQTKLTQFGFKILNGTPIKKYTPIKYRQLKIT